MKNSKAVFFVMASAFLGSAVYASGLEVIKNECASGGVPVLGSKEIVPVSKLLTRTKIENDMLGSALGKQVGSGSKNEEERARAIDAALMEKAGALRLSACEILKMNSKITPAKMKEYMAGETIAHFADASECAAEIIKHRINQQLDCVINSHSKSTVHMTVDTCKIQ